MSTSYRLTAVSSKSTSGPTGTPSQHSSSALSGSGNTIQNTSSQQQVPPLPVNSPTHQATIVSQSATTHVPPTVSPPQPLPAAKLSASPWLAIPRTLSQASAASWFGAGAFINTLVFAVVMYLIAAWTARKDFREICMAEPEIHRTIECNITLAHPPPPPPFVKITTIEGTERASVDWATLIGFPQIIPSLAMHAVIGITTVLPSNWKHSSRIPTRLERSFIAREILSRQTLAAVIGPNLFGLGLRSSCTNESDYTFALQEYSGWIPVFNSNPQTTAKLLEEHHLDRWSDTRLMILVVALITVIPICYGKIKHVFHTVYHQQLSDRTGHSNTASLLSWMDTVQMPFAVIALRCAPPWLSILTVGYLCALLYLKTRYSEPAHLQHWFCYSEHVILREICFFLDSRGTGHGGEPTFHASRQQGRPFRQHVADSNWSDVFAHAQRCVCFVPQAMRRTEHLRYHCCVSSQSNGFPTHVRH
jgi:hypothetical protein